MKLQDRPRLDLVYLADNIVIPFRKGQIADLNDFLDGFGEVDPDAEYELKLTKIKRIRSLDANSYFWTLCGKLACKTGQKKTDVYRQLIKEIGGNYTVVCVQDTAVESLVKNWEHNGLGWVTDTTKSRLPGCTNVLLYTGSSAYDTKQMSRLIDLTVDECKAQGIETMTPNELEELKQKWGV